jgi:hypothetical protein
MPPPLIPILLIVSACSTPPSETITTNTQHDTVEPIPVPKEEATLDLPTQEEQDTKSQPEIVDPKTSTVDAPPSKDETGIGHCRASETVFFSCAFKGGKVVSLCGLEDATWLQYRFGHLGKTELVYPEDGAPSVFDFAEERWASGIEASVGFVRNEFGYRLVDAYGSGINGDMNNYIGLQVDGENGIPLLRCHDQIQTPNLRTLQTLWAARP